MRPVLRLIDLVRRNLHADDAYLRVGRPPVASPAQIIHPLGPECWVVACFETPPASTGELTQRLAELCTAFTGTVDDSLNSIETVLHRPPDQGALTQTLVDLCRVTTAVVALVTDQQSPMIWACSDPDLKLTDRHDVQRWAEPLAALYQRGLDPVTEATSTEKSDDMPAEQATVLGALRDAHHHRSGGAMRLAAAIWAIGDLPAPSSLPNTPQIVTKEFSVLYRITLAFMQPFSPLRVEGTLRRALPIIERHLFELPPIDPPPESARVLPLKRE